MNLFERWRQLSLPGLARLPEGLVPPEKLPEQAANPPRAATNLVAPLKAPAQPLANRHTVLDGVGVPYEFKRSNRRRSIGFVVRAEGLTVTAPRWATATQIEEALHSRAGWILRKLGEARERSARDARLAQRWEGGAPLAFQGRALRLDFAPEGRAAKQARLSDDGTRLLLPLTPGAGAHAIQVSAQRWLLRRAHDRFVERLDHFAPQVGVRWRRLSVMHARSRWGSASGDGAIRLNWRLIEHRDALLDYVVVHELAHLLEMNHSPRFWAIVGRVLPDYPRLRRELREHPLADALGEADDATE